MKTREQILDAATRLAVNSVREHAVFTETHYTNLRGMYGEEQDDFLVEEVAVSITRKALENLENDLWGEDDEDGEE